MNGIEPELLGKYGRLANREVNLLFLVFEDFNFNLKSVRV